MQCFLPPDKRWGGGGGGNLWNRESRFFDDELHFEFRYYIPKHPAKMLKVVICHSLKRKISLDLKLH